MWPMSANALCLFFMLIGWPSVRVTSILAVVYFYGLLLSYRPFSYYECSLFNDIKIRNKQNKRFFCSEDLPSSPPLFDQGYVWAKEPSEYGNAYSDYSKPFIVNIVFSCNNCTILIGGMKCASGQIFYKEEYDKLKTKALYQFEKAGYYIKAIKNKYGDYLWIRGKQKGIRKIDLAHIIISQVLLESIWFACQALPLIAIACFNIK